MKQYLVAVVLFLVPLCGHAESNDNGKGFYGSVGVGMFEYKGIKPLRQEEELAALSGVESSSSIKDRSSFKFLGLGYCFNQYFCGEGSYTWGITAETNFIASHTDVPFTISARREASLTAYQLSVLGKLPITKNVDIFARVGMYKYKIEATGKLTFSPGFTLLLQDETMTDTTPTASLGVDWKPFEKVGFRVEGTKIGKITMGSVGLTYNF